MFTTLKRHARAATLILSTLGAGFGPQAAQAAPLTTHPRLWITSSDLPRLRSWAVTSNPMWKDGLLTAATSAKAYTDAHWNWASGKPDSAWRDTGSSNWEADDTEAYAQFFAFMSLVDPNGVNRTDWASRARKMLMWAINQAATNGPGQPFGDANIATYNRANYWGEAWGLTVDWIYASLSASDKATIRKVFLKWGNAILNASTAGNEHPQPVGVMNDLRLLGSGPGQTALEQQRGQMQLRWAANNYFLGHMRNMTTMALAFDAADDDTSNPALGASLKSLVDDGIGAWLYQAYAMFETPATLHAKLGVPTSNRSIGLASGGLAVEGSLYGESLSYLLQDLWALRTAGYTDTATYGPQVGFLDSPYWSQSMAGYLNSISPQAAAPSDPNYAYLGPVYQVANYGDLLNSYEEYERIDLLGTLAAIDRSSNPARYMQDIWAATNTLQGGATALYGRAARIWGNSNASYAILYFLGYDPAIAAPADPRPSLSPQFISAPIGRILARSDWGANASWFTFRCGWESINHQNGDCGQFEFFRKGTWLTKEWSGYDNDGLLTTPLYHNTLGIQNTAPADGGGWLYGQVVQKGGQWNNAGSNGDPLRVVEVNDNFALASVDATNLYNHPSFWTAANGAESVSLAWRNVVWLNPDHIVVYDRVTTKKAGGFKTFNLVLLSPPSISGNKAVSVAGNQQLTVTSLLPQTAALAEQHFWKNSPAEEFNSVAALDPARNRLVISDSAKPASTRFLTVLQGTDKGVAADPATAFASSAGSSFQGAVVAGNTAVLFANGGSFNGTTYLVPSTVTRHVITGLAPKTGYTVTITQGASGKTVQVATGGATSTDASGVLAIGFPASTRPTQSGSWGAWTLMQPE